MASSTSIATAIVNYPPSPEVNLRCEQVKVSETLGEHELLVQMVATGICHSDIHVASTPETAITARYPRILGHEGSGYVRAVGQKVSVAAVGDPVVLSFNYCGNCEMCSTGQPAYCFKFTPLNLMGENQENYTTADGGNPVYGKFFGQSSFSSLSVVDENSIVNMKGKVQGREELRLLGPLGCGFQTGAGAVANAAKAGPNDIVVVAGLGAVGLGAVMAAKIAGCAEIVAIDRIESRLEIAKSVGATIVFNTTGEDSFGGKIGNLVGNRRVSIVVETTGVASVVQSLVDCLGYRGRYLQIGFPADPSATLSIPLNTLLAKRVIIESNIEGSAIPREFIPKMLEWYRQGDFPLDKFSTFFPASEIDSALSGMNDGSVIKPVLEW